MYSNLTPVLALITAVVFLGDRLGPREAAGAAAILIGVGVARVASAGSAVLPAEE
jgi:drug/metabolite transporter (DMT)-like permease